MLTVSTVHLHTSKFGVERGLSEKVKSHNNYACPSHDNGVPIYVITLGPKKPAVIER